MASAVSRNSSSRGALHVACSDFAVNSLQTAKGTRSREMQEGGAATAAAGAGSVESGGCSESRSRGRCSSGLEEDHGGQMGAKAEAAAAAAEQQLQPRRRKSRAGEQAAEGGGGGAGGGVEAADENGSRSMGRAAAGGEGEGSAAGGAAAAASAAKPGEGGELVAAAEGKAGCGSSREQRLFYGAFLLLGSTIAVSQVVALPVLLQMLLYTAPILYIGSHASLRQNEVDACTGERPNRTESMNHTDALLFPVFGSIALVTMYVAYKFLDASWVNFLLTLYLTAIGFFALGETINVAVHPFLPAWMTDESRVSFHLRLPHIPVLLPAPAAVEGTAADGKAAEEDAAAYHCRRSYAQLLSYAAAAGLSCIWLWKKHWVVHNLLAIAFCIQAIGLVSVGNFTVATILLSGLFVYDIFWVFGTDVMVTVAQSFEGPAKLIFPVQLKPWQQSILGLGDVVVPGVLISMCLRFDYWLHGAGNSSSVYNSSSGAAGQAARRAAGADGAAETAAAADGGDAGSMSGAASAAAAAEGEAVLTRRGKAARAAAAAAAEAEGEKVESLAAAPHAQQQLGKETSNNSNESSGLLPPHYHPSTQAGDIVHHRFNKFYFWVVLIFYECGLITTGVVMLLFQHPQPALLYLVPFCLFALFGAAALNGQVKEVLAYSEDDESAAAGAAAAAAERSAAAADDAAAASCTNTAAEGEEDEDEEDEEEEEGQKRKTR